MYVFVYGTLKKDEPNFHWLSNTENGKSKFVSKGKTILQYPLIIASRYNIPFLLDKPGTGKKVEGEIYEIDDSMLSNLDILEEYPKLYTRRLEKIICISSKKRENDDDGPIVEAWTYFLSQFRPELLDLPYLECYTSNGLSNSEAYVARYLREFLTDHRLEVKK